VTPKTNYHTGKVSMVTRDMNAYTSSACPFPLILWNMK